MALSKCKNCRKSILLAKILVLIKTHYPWNIFNKEYLPGIIISFQCFLCTLPCLFYAFIPYSLIWVTDFIKYWEWLFTVQPAKTVRPEDLKWSFLIYLFCDVGIFSEGETSICFDNFPSYSMKMVLHKDDKGAGLDRWATLDLGKFAKSFSFIPCSCTSFFWVLSWSYTATAQEVPGNYIHLKQLHTGFIPENFAVPDLWLHALLCNYNLLCFNN